MTIDIAGAHISGASNSALFVIDNGAEVSITDSNRKYSFDYDLNVFQSITDNFSGITNTGKAIEIKNDGKLILDTVNVVSTTDTAIVVGEDNNVSSGTLETVEVIIQGKESAIQVYSNSKVDVKQEGFLIGEDNAVIAGKEGGTTDIKIEGAEIFAHSQTPNYLSCGIYHPENGSLTLDGTRIISSNGIGILSRSGIILIQDAEITTEGTGSGKVATVNNLDDHYAICLDLRDKYPGYDNSIIEIYGGIFVTESNVPIISMIAPDGVETNDRIVVTGGTYASPIDEDFLGVGCTLIEEDGI